MSTPVFSFTLIYLSCECHLDVSALPQQLRPLKIQLVTKTANRSKQFEEFLQQWGKPPAASSTPSARRLAGSWRRQGNGCCAMCGQRGWRQRVLLLPPGFHTECV